MLRRICFAAVRMSARLRTCRLVASLMLTAILLTAAGVQGQRSAVSQAYQLSHTAKYDPSLSPDGKRMVYITVVEGREQLFIMNVDGAGAVQLTRDDADHEDPAWSPDGKSIAFVYVKDGLEIISLMNVGGSGVQRLTPGDVKAIHPNWSPDGSKLAYCTDDDLAPPRKNDADIVVIDVDTRRTRTLITGGVNTYPAWSPDGKRLAFRRMLGEMNSEVFVANADGSGARNLTNHPAFDGWPAWSPDGTRIAFASNRNSSYQIFMMNADGSDVRLLANTEGRATAPQWGRDGARIYFPICRNVDFGFDCEIFAARTQGFAR
jgi:TolB protein